jgi:hypothetical protein
MIAHKLIFHLYMIVICVAVACAPFYFLHPYRMVEMGAHHFYCWICCGWVALLHLFRGILAFQTTIVQPVKTEEEDDDEEEDDEGDENTQTVKDNNQIPAIVNPLNAKQINMNPPNTNPINTNPLNTINKSDNVVNIVQRKQPAIEQIQTKPSSVAASKSSNVADRNTTPAVSGTYLELDRCMAMANASMHSGRTKKMR